MPREEYYGGLPLAERLRKLRDFHGQPRTRHLSNYEQAMLDEAAARLEETFDIAQERARRELEGEWRVLRQTYMTSVAFGNGEVRVLSIPAWQLAEDSSASLESTGTLLTQRATPIELQAALAALVEVAPAALDDRGRLYQERFTAFIRNPRQLSALNADLIAVVNRLLYQPVVALEQSAPRFEPLVEIYERSKSTGAPVVAFLLGLQAFGPLIALITALGVILVQCMTAVAVGAYPGLEELGRSLTRRFSDTPGGRSQSLPASDTDRLETLPGLQPPGVTELRRGELPPERS